MGHLGMAVFNFRREADGFAQGREDFRVVLQVVMGELSTSANGTCTEISGQSLATDDLRNRLLFKLQPPPVHPIPHVVLVEQAD